MYLPADAGSFQLQKQREKTEQSRTGTEDSKCYYDSLAHFDSLFHFHSNVYYKNLKMNASFFENDLNWR